MDRFHIIKHPLGGSDVYDSSGKQIGYSLPGVLGDGEDFYDMEGNPVGMSFDDQYGMSDFIGTGNDTYGYMDQEILMGRNAWLNGNPFQQEDNPGLDDLNGLDSIDAGPDFGDGGLE